MPSVAEILPKSSELEENGYVQGRIGLYNVDADDDTKIESDPERFFARTYPSGKLKSVLLDIDDNFRGYNPSGNYVIDGTFGSGKSHLMVTLYHLFSHPSKANEWLHTHNIDLEPPDQARIVSYSLQDTQPEIFWDPFFKTLEAEDLVEDVDAYPDKSTIENALPGDEPVLVLIDEIEDYYGSISDETKKRGISGFIQALTEAAAEPENELYTVASLLRLGEGSGIVSKFNRDDASGESLTDAPDNTEIIRYRLFQIQSFDEGAANQVIDQYTNKYQQSEHIDLDSAIEYEDEIQNSYPFHPNLMEILEERFYNSAEYQSTRGMLYLLSCVAVNRSEDTDLFTASDVDLLNQNTLNQLTRVDRSVVENAKSDIERVDHIEYGQQIINALTIHSLNVGPHEGADDAELLLGVLRTDDRTQDILDARGKMRGIARHLHKLNGEWAMKEQASIEVVANNQLDDVDDPRALSRLAVYVRNKVFGGNTYVLKKDNDDYTTYGEPVADQTPEIKVLATLWGLNDDERKEALRGKSNPNTILIVEPTGGPSVSLRNHTQLLTKIKRVITYENLEEEFDEEAKQQAAKLRDEEEQEIIDRLRGSYGNWIKFSGGTTIPKGVDADDATGFQSYYDMIVEKAEADIMDIRSTIEDAIDGDQTGVGVSQLLEDFRIQRGYPVLVDEDKFDEAIKQLVSDDEAAIQESGGVWKRSRPRTIDRTAHIIDPAFAPDQVDPLSVGISADVTKCTPGTSGQFTITTSSQDYDAGNLDINWSVNDTSVSQNGGSFSYTFQDEGRHNIEVTARHEDTNQTDTAQHTVDVQPQVDLGIDLMSRPASPIQVDEEIEFDAIVSGSDNQDMEYKWGIDGEEETGADGRTFSQEFGEEGVYDVSVQVEAGGEEVSDQSRVQVNDAGPLLSTINETGQSGSAIASNLEDEITGGKVRSMNLSIEGEVSGQDALLAIRRLPDVDDGEIQVNLRVEEVE